MTRSPSHLLSLTLVFMLGCTVWISSSSDRVSFPMVAVSVMKLGESLSGKAHHQWQSHQLMYLSECEL